jgi:hypothetical protein
MRRFRAWPLVLSFVGLSVVVPEAARATCTVPNQLTNGQTADASQVMANFNSVTSCVNNAPTGSTNALQYNTGNGSFGAVGPLSNGQIAIGSTGSAPQAAQLTAGSGITITNAPGSIMISEANSPYTPPKLTNFAWGNQPAGATAADTSTGLALYTPPNGRGEDDAAIWDNGAYPSTPFTVVVGVSITQVTNSTPSFGVNIGDGSGKIVGLRLFNSGGLENIQVGHLTYTAFGSQVFNVGANNIRFLAIEDDGTNFSFYIGGDLNALVKVYQESRTAYLSNPSQLGVSVNSPSGSFGTAATIFDYSK